MQELINILSKPFDTNAFTMFAKEMLKTAQTKVIGPLKGSMGYQSFEDKVASLTRILQYEEAETGKKIDVLVIKVNKAIHLDRARTHLRNVVVEYLDKRNAASQDPNPREYVLAAFYADDAPIWRLSFIHQGFKLRPEENGKVELEKELTPARRYSFLLGEGEPVHTAQKQLKEVLNLTTPPKISEIEGAFAVEKVSDEFFREYSNLFNKTLFEVKELTKSYAPLRAALEGNNELEVNEISFTKKLLGQIVFLYFLQKKGWLGVEKGKLFGTGQKDFIRKRWNTIGQNNFFNNFLKYLFYEALATQRQNAGDANYYERFECRIPFLNGGLFEAPKNINWKELDLTLPNDLFSNTERTKAGDLGTGILDVFDRYNFTVKEDEPLEREVAVDPEMLGKVFEGMLDPSERGSKGSFYTPREIVHYMCQESLAYYLNTKLPDIDLSTLQDFLKYTTQYMADTRHIKQSKVLDKEIVNNAEAIDEILSNIKVCDPAIGSGAFPVGMLTEIVNARLALNTSNSFEEASVKQRTPYKLKRHAIQHSLYGVDIDGDAVEIAKLRLWLSMVVDEEDATEIMALPNLDYKIMQGNSLIESYHGVSLKELAPSKTDDSFITNKPIQLKMYEKTAIQTGINFNQSDLVTNIEISSLANKYFNSTNKQEKDEIKTKIDNLVLEHVRWNLEMHVNTLDKKLMNALDTLNKQPAPGSGKDNNQIKRNAEIRKKAQEQVEILNSGKERYLLSLRGLDDWQKSNNNKPFLWHLYFKDVFDKGGFDVIIGNPPYVQIQSLSKSQIQADLQNEGYQTFSKTSDLYCLFYEKAFGVLNHNGILCFITSNKWMRAGYGLKTRNYFLNEVDTKLVVDFAGVKLFSTATVDTNIMIAKKNKPTSEILGLSVQTDYNWHNNLGDYIRQAQKYQSFSIGSSWVISGSNDDLKKLIATKGVPLSEWNLQINRGIITGLNEAFIIDTATKDRLCQEDPKSVEIIRPILRGKDIKAWMPEWTGLHIILATYGSHEWLHQYPAIYKHLQQFEHKLRSRGQCNYTRNQGMISKEIGEGGQHHWIELDNNPTKKYISTFAEPKIIYPNMTKYLPFVYDKGAYFCNDKAFIITGDDLVYLCAILNSNVFKFAFKDRFPELLGGTREIRKIFFKDIPIIPFKTINGQAKLTHDKILSLLNSDDYSISDLIRLGNKLAYQVYDITSEEQGLIESYLSDNEAHAILT